jgi:hypothetical protein
MGHRSPAHHDHALAMAALARATDASRIFTSGSEAARPTHMCRHHAASRSLHAGFPAILLAIAVRVALVHM